MTSQLNQKKSKSVTLTVTVTVSEPDKDEFYKATAIGLKGEVSCVSRSPSVAIGYVLETLGKEYLNKFP